MAQSIWRKNIQRLNCGYSTMAGRSAKSKTSGSHPLTLKEALKKRPRKKRKYNLESQIRNALRKVWRFSPMRAAALAAARISGDLYMCAKCGKPFHKPDVEVNHIEQAAQGDGWGPFIQRLLYMPLDGLEVLCKPCHSTKTKEQRNAHPETI